MGRRSRRWPPRIGAAARRGSPVTLEPGGQIELSTPPADDVVAAVAALRADREVLRRPLREPGFGAAPLGADLARPVHADQPGPPLPRDGGSTSTRSAAPASGKEMMSATAALQVNLDAGPADGWERAAGADPVDGADAGRRSRPPRPTSAGRTSGWHSMRQGTWQGIDHGRSDPVPPGEPTDGVGDLRPDAPVMLVRDGGRAGARHATRVSFAAVAARRRPVRAAGRRWPTSTTT